MTTTPQKKKSFEQLETGKEKDKLKKERKKKKQERKEREVLDGDNNSTKESIAICRSNQERSN
jgi:hypothetical protein